MKRHCDDELYDALQKGEFCYIFNARQTGKSSLRIRSAQRLQNAGIRSSVIDMTIIGSQQVTPNQWYASVLQLLISGLQLNVNLREWWGSRTYLSLSE